MLECKSLLESVGRSFTAPTNPYTMWKHVTMDYIKGLPRSEGYDTILVIVNRLTKYANFNLLRHPFTTLKLVDKFIKVVARLHGFPISIVFNQDKVFMSIFLHELFRLQHTALKRSTA